MLMDNLQESFSACSSLGFSSSSPNPKTLSIDVELWLVAEQRTQEILWTIQPNVASEWRRRALIGSVQRLIKAHFGTMVFSFGSVPLKAYLPDGDIDLTAICHQNVEDDLARAVCDVLESQPKDSWLQINDVRYVRAQVKVVKCTVNNIALDISFNQIAGLCTLCFLEQVDQLIGKDHLLKKSIILIKAWCYYESRLLGAHYGLISTYALETLVLFIINLFHSSLRCPLEVLHRFLEYYSTFDWDNYCISINGPVAISSLPGIIVMPQNEGEELLLSEEFVTRCRDIFSDPSRAHGARVHEFPTKHLNIVDPLKENNNLGRSVSKGNFYRIRSAFSYGAQKLRAILMLPGERIGQELEKFFLNTIDRNGRGQRADVQIPVAAFGTGISEVSNLEGEYETYCRSLLYGQALHLSANPGAQPSEVHNRTTWNALAWSAQLNWNVFCERAINMYPRLQLLLPSASQPSAATLGVGTRWKPQGTGTFIPDMTQNYSRYVHPRARGRFQESSTGRVPESSTGRILESSTHSAMMKSPRESDQVEISSRTGMSGNVSRFNLSSEEFPVLPGTQRPPSQVHKSGQSTLASSPAKSRNFKLGSSEHSPSPSKSRSSKKLGSSEHYSLSPSKSRSFKLGSSEHSPSPSGMPSPVARQQANIRVSYALNFIPGVPNMEMQKQQLSEVDKEACRIHFRQFKLDNDKDFPP